MTALAGVDLEVGEGELVGLLGPNGAGKSTLVKIACGLVRPPRGDARGLGARAGSIEARARIGYLAELFRFPGWYTRGRAARAAPAAGWIERRRRRAGRASRARRALRGARPPSRADVEGHAAAARDRAGACRQASAAAPRRADERARPGRAPHRSRAPRGAARPGHLRAAQLPPAERDRTGLRPRGDPPARPARAEGSPAELARARGVEIETDEGVRLFEGASRDDAPRLVAELVAAGRRVYGVSVLTSTLEDTYLEAVGGETS